MLSGYLVGGAACINEDIGKAPEDLLLL